MDNKKRLKTRQKIKESVNFSQRIEDAKSLKREISRRQATGKQFCPDKYYGYVSESTICDACLDSSDCLEATKKRLQTISEQLYKLFDDDSCYHNEDWSDPSDIDVEEKRHQISNFVTMKMDEIEENPNLFLKVRNIPKLTNKTLDVLVPGWKSFRQEKPKLNRCYVISRLEQITRETKDYILESASNTNIDIAWSDIVEENIYYDPIRKTIVTRIYNQLQEYCVLLREAFPKEFDKEKRDEKHWPAKWMQNDKEIRAMLIKFPHFESILNILWRQRKRQDYQQSQKQMERLLVDVNDDEKKIVDSSESDRDRALLPESVTYESIAKELGKSVSLVQKYVKAMNDIGVLKVYSQKGRNSFTILSIGYWTEWNKKNRVIPYLQEKVYGKKGPKYQDLVNFRVDYNT